MNTVNMISIELDTEGNVKVCKTNRHAYAIKELMV